MGEKPILGDPLSRDEQQQVTAYLIAITPNLQRSAKAKRAVVTARQQTMDSLGQRAAPAATAPALDSAAARSAYEDTCSLCHELTDVDDNPPRTATEVDALVERMIDNGLDAEPDELVLVKWYLREALTKPPP